MRFQRQGTYLAFKKASEIFFSHVQAKIFA